MTLLYTLFFETKNVIIIMITKKNTSFFEKESQFCRRLLFLRRQIFQHLWRTKKEFPPFAFWERANCCKFDLKSTAAEHFKITEVHAEVGLPF